MNLKFILVSTRSGRLNKGTLGYILVFLFFMFSFISSCKKSVRIAKINITQLNASIVGDEIKITPRVRNIGAIQTETKLYTTCTLFGDREVKADSVITFLSLTPGESTEIAPVLIKDTSPRSDTKFFCSLVDSEDSAKGVIENTPMEGKISNP